ncbi:hypothetical protein [Allomuricauda sp. SCSIO 65647]|uniref:hypothetical protein n=1 Tax=Allomuricauda sp. SCSIO 65647 TaxID=2908843 RepID=UPI001F483724|nr:hypothetical protein [Muricauda sp. SCSIO 65647]UJH67803.1 hypothetical protein L0P89_00955 [Muricauda sp. SCSIO 65647]
MKTTFRLFIIAGMVFFAQSLFNPIHAQEKKKEDPRIRVEDNKVKIWLFNEQRSDLVVKIYDRQSNLVRKVKLGDGLTVGKILDFNGSENAYYRLVVLDGKEVLYHDKIKLGTT